MKSAAESGPPVLDTARAASVGLISKLITVQSAGWKDNGKSNGFNIKGYSGLLKTADRKPFPKVRDLVRYEIWNAWIVVQNSNQNWCLVFILG